MEKTRYTDEELEEFRQIILEKLELARTEYEELRRSLSLEDGNGTQDTSPTLKLLDEGAMTLSLEESSRLAHRQQKFIQHLEADRQQDLRHMPRNGEADSQRTSAGCSPRNPEH